jgi:hypothetical protein
LKKHKPQWEVVCFVRVSRNCIHATYHPMFLTLGELKKLSETPCPDCAEPSDDSKKKLKRVR